MFQPPTDSYHRRIDYLRLSITDRCNLRCLYCMPAGGIPKLDHDGILRYEEIMRIARIAVHMGISKIRITGGEPLVRKDVLYLCENVAKIPGLKSLSLTTNGVLLSQFADSLFRVGIKRINISLDTLNPAKFEMITRRNLFHEVWEGIEAAQKAGFAPIKLNTVVMRGVNDDEIEDLARLTFRYPFHVRFIEFMPFRPDEQCRKFLSSDEILDRLSKVAPLLPAQSINSNGPALHYRFPGALGKVGIISPISHHFCSSCNRLRVTSDGKLRTCLFASEETDLLSLLRQGALDEDIIQHMRQAIARKPERHALGDVLRKCISRPMFSIGG
ncbi:GTP 3',8-cyclase MoaA [Desulforhabdus amnigena]|uniref:GTP 3',8-cyclase n=1 Tax=Desulforhabdus amnigena TaxID=40218 RepID=A0A9W6L8R8_9BACT|nr:GTP 3',8-cyclase MoaA [Desulforhabdus amnigena]NLJ27439.1 GTP 3',8-cyclase MoaA [Deltaproteobacteria bacterium]GLI34964.1 GTP 3',8-cyclase [Desulforhabdus amnigena]